MATFVSIRFYLSNVNRVSFLGQVLIDEEEWNVNFLNEQNA